MTPENNRHTRLQKLKGSDFQMADGDPDIRGWDVKDSSGKQLGEVEELIFDIESRKVRYLVVDLEENDFDLEDKEVLVPVGIAELHKSDDDVILTGISAEQLNALPEYDEDRFDTDHETSVRNVFGGLGAAASGTGSNDEDFYNHEHFNEANLYRNRTSELDTDDAPNITEGEENIHLRSQEVHVNKTRVNRAATENDFREQTLELHEHNELPVIIKDEHVAEQISPGKVVRESDENISQPSHNTAPNAEKDDDDNFLDGKFKF